MVLCLLVGVALQYAIGLTAGWALGLAIGVLVANFVPLRPPVKIDAPN